MLADKDRIFTNLYGFHSPDLSAAKMRGAWDARLEALLTPIASPRSGTAGRS